MANQAQKDKWADEDVPRKLPAGVKLVRTLRGHTGFIARLAWSPDGRMLASSSEDRTVGLWDAEGGQVLHVLEGHGRRVTCVAFDHTGQMLASGSSDYTVRLWEPQSGHLLRTLGGHWHSILCVAFDPTSQMLASGSADHKVKLWEPSTGKSLRTLEGHGDWVCSVAFDPTGRMLASGGADAMVKLWEAGSGKLLRTLKVPKEKVFSVAFDLTGQTLVSGGDGGTVKLWRADKGKLFRQLEGHTKAVISVAFPTSQQVVVSKSLDGTIRLWALDSGNCLAVIPERSSAHWMQGIAFHPHRPWLATVGSDPGTRTDRIIHIWELDLGVLRGQPIRPTVTYTSAKVVVVGESNVGKSYLAHRIATGRPPEEGTIKSTHGMRFWALGPEQLSPGSKMPTNQRRDVVLWDMGGQEEYRLIHQLFLHDTTVALILLDPTRGATAFKEVETWNKSLERQLHGRAAVKLLVGAKLDQPSDTIDRQGIERLLRDCAFTSYLETSAITGRGVRELCEATAKAIDWDGLGKTSRPELFQRIRDEIEARRKRGQVVLHIADLHDALWKKQDNAREIVETDGAEAVEAVTGQLATQGVIARSRVSTGEPVLVLQIQEIERYAGSLILAARNNPRGVPALELRAIAQADLSLPGISEQERLPRNQEEPVLECTVQLMLEHGICFQHEGLLVFPSLFARASEAVEVKLPHAVSLYYDFAGAIDNIYASLVAWLVLARDFGRVRLWSDRAEFEIKDGGLCGLRKVGRPGGFAHVDVYFEADTPERQRKQFISFVEDHLERNGVEIREHVAIKCVCGHEFAEETLRQRIARGDKDVVCSVCETRHSLTEGAAEVRERDPKIVQHTWALRTQIEKLREKITKQVVQVLAKAEAKPATAPIRLLHLSDLHFIAATPIRARLQWLLDDLKLDGGLGFKELDYLVISGDFTDKGSIDGFERAYEFVSGLTHEFSLSAERCIFVPGNHDIVDLQEAYEWRKKADGLVDGTWVKQGDIILARNAAKYPLRFRPFSDGFFHKFLQRPYPTDYAEQGMAIPFWETGIQFLALNSCWQIDEFHRKRAGLLPEALAHTIKEAQNQESEARKSGQLAPGKPLLRIAVCHHAVAGLEQMKDVELLGHLQRNNVRIALHGDVHEMRREFVGYRHEKSLHVAGSGSFGARAEELVEATPRLYNVLEIDRDLNSVRVHTREQRKPDSPWDGWYEWPDRDGGKSRVPYYDIRW